MVEAQAAARVDRLDQQKDIVILRYIVEESIEKVGLLIVSIAVMRLIGIYVVDKSPAES